MSDEEQDNVVKLDFNGPGLAIIRTQVPRCFHRRVLVDESRRVVSCGSCDAVLDPFDVLLDYARHERNFHYATTEAVAKKKGLEESVRGLERSERNVKARLRKLGKRLAKLVGAEEASMVVRIAVKGAPLYVRQSWSHVEKWLAEQGAPE